MRLCGATALHAPMLTYYQLDSMKYASVKLNTNTGLFCQDMNWKCRRYNFTCPLTWRHTATYIRVNNLILIYRPGGKLFNVTGNPMGWIWLCWILNIELTFVQTRTCCLTALSNFLNCRADYLSIESFGKQANLIQNTNIFNQVNAFENAACKLAAISRDFISKQSRFGRRLHLAYTKF